MTSGNGYAASKHLFGFSILYLFLVFALLLIDRMLGRAVRPLRGMALVSEPMDERTTPPRDREPARHPAHRAQLRARRSRSIAIALALGAFVVVIFLVTMVSLGSNVVGRPM